jgi:hypothetical protein
MITQLCPQSVWVWGLLASGRNAYNKKPKADFQSLLGLLSVPCSKAQSDFALQNNM